jgi:hypothetical protein
MSDVTDTQQKKLDPWNDDPDPQPEDFDEYIAEMGPEDIECLPGDPNARVIFIDGDDEEEWLKKRAAAHARGERLPEEIEADEAAEKELAARAREAL